MSKERIQSRMHSGLAASDKEAEKEGIGGTGIKGMFMLTIAGIS